VSGTGSRAKKASPSTAVPPRGSARKGQRGPSPASSGGTRSGQPRVRASQQAWQARRRRNRWIAGAAVVVVLAVVGALLATKAAGGGSGGAPRKPLPPAAAAQLTSVPLTTLLAAGAKQPVTWPSSISQPSLTAGGKPEMLYIGAEFCPICATQRWPMVVALSHFGTFSNLQQTHSAVPDGNIPTLSFYGSTFTSPYLTFTPVETTTNQPSGGYYKTLETPTAAQNALWQANSPNGAETFPFIDIGGKWLLQTSQFPATALEGKSFNDILGSVGNNNNTIGAAIDASAAVLIQKICTITGQKPAATCAAAKAAPLAPQASTSGASSSASG
jgi:Domain of unknown function (DUF929)